MGRSLGMAVSFSLDRGYRVVFQVAFWGYLWGYLKRKVPFSGSLSVEWAWFLGRLPFGLPENPFSFFR